MEVYKLRCVRVYDEFTREISRTFLSPFIAERYRRLFLYISKESRSAAGIFPIQISDHGAMVYVLTEDNHGEIGYFFDKDKAYEAARDVIMENPEWTEWNGHGYDVHEVTRDQITDEEIDDYKYLVGIRVYPANTAWCH